MCKKIKAWFKSLFGKKEECKCKCECTCEKEKEVVTEIPVQPQKPQEPQPKPYDGEEQKPTEPANKPINKKVVGDPKAPKQTPQKSEKEVKETKPVEEANKEGINKEENKNVIAPKQFFRNKDLVTYTIKNETEIGDSAFYGCINLEQLIIKTKKVPKLGKEAIHTRVNRKLVVIPKLQILVPEKMIEKYKNNKVWGKYADKIKPIVK